MTGPSTLPSTREQAWHVLLLLGVPTAPRLLVDVHAALFDGDLSVPALVALVRDEERTFGRDDGTGPSAYLVCPGLDPDLAPVRGLVTLSTWSVAERICTPAAARADALATVVRVAEVVAARPGACAASLLRQLAETVPGGPEAFDVLDPPALAEVARAALADPTLTDAVAAEEPVRAAAAARAADLAERLRLFGVPVVPHQRDGA